MRALRLYSGHWAPALAVVAIAGFSTGRWFQVATNSPLASDRARWAGTLLAKHPFEARFRALPASTGLRAAPLPAGASREIRRLELEVARSHSPEALSDLALVQLARGQDEWASRLLAEAVAIAPRDAPLQAELGANFLERALRTDPPSGLALAQALETTERALAKKPYLLEALYNRALALQKLFFTHQARDAWDEYLKLDTSSAWSERARDHRSRLDGSTPPEQWEIERSRLEEAARRQDLEAGAVVVARFPDYARLWVEEELLGEWANAMAAKDANRAADRLVVARFVAERVADRGDHMAADVVKTIQEALRSGSPALGHLAAGHRLFQDGLAAECVYEYGRGEAAFSAARERLARGRSPFARWAEVHLGTREFYRQDYDAARTWLANAMSDLDSDRYPSLAGRIIWLTGTMYIGEGRPALALARNREAFARLEPLEEWGHLSFLHSAIAWDLHNLGEAELAAAERLSALRLASSIREPRRIYSVFLATSKEAEASERPHVAAHALREAEWRLGSHVDPPILAELLHRRAPIERRMGENKAALASLARARSVATSIGDENMQARVEADIDLSEGLLHQEDDPEACAAALSRALDFYRRTKYRLETVEILRTRAESHTHRGDWQSAEEDLAAAIGEYERNRAEILNDAQRVSYFELGQQVLDEMIALQIGPLSHPVNAWTYAEQARARSLLDLMAAQSGPAQPARLAEVLAAIPEKTTVIEYAVLPDRLVAWALRRKGWSVAERELPARELASLVEVLTNAFRQNRSLAEQRTSATELGELLLGHLAPKLHAGGTLVFIPDKCLHLVPFAALVDPVTGRYLVEDHAVAVAPSASIFTQAITEDARRTNDEFRWLAVVNTSFNRRCFPDLGELPGVESELQALRIALPEATVLAGREATTESFLRLATGFEALYVAGHSVVNPVRPQDSALLFAPQLAPPAGDCGTLTARELYKLELPKTRLVVLAACSTAVGGTQSREGVMSLARPFLAAGVPAVLASLWNVSDRATTDLLRRFHSNSAVSRNPGEALRQAQLGLLQQGRPPFEWAAFQLTGAGRQPGHRLHAVQELTSGD